MYGISTLTGDDPDKIAALDIYDEALWKRCNPNYGVILQPRKFRAEANEGNGPKIPDWLRRYCAYVLPCIVAAIFIYGLATYF